MEFIDIVKITLTEFQNILDKGERNLQVAELDDRDSLIGELEWDYIITEHNSPDDGFNCKFCWKNQNKILGVFISRYKIDTQCLEIYGIENFNRNEFNQMLFNSLSVVYMLLVMIKGKSVKLVNVEKGNVKLRALYNNFGFKECMENSDDFIQSTEELKVSLRIK
ncbi:hypothetical protein ACWIUA_07360 [Ursidibacter sp. B-7004-1]